MNELQHRVQEIINLSGKAERGQSTTINSNHTSELRDEVECHKDQCREQREELMQNKGKLKLCEEKSEHLQAKVGRQFFLQSKEQQQVAGHGVVNEFLERHSEDKHLSKCSYYTNAEKMLTENSSLQGASHVDSMVNLTESNKAQLYFGECQVPLRPDPYSQTYASLFPQTSGACIGGNNSSNTGLNLLNPNVANNFVPFTGLQDGTFPSLQRNEVFHSGFTGSGLTSDFMQPTGSQIGAFNPLNSNLSIKGGLNTSEEVNSRSSAMNASSRAYDSSSSHVISGTDTGESQSGETEDSVPNRNYGTESVESTNNSLLELDQRFEEAGEMVDRVLLKEREEREAFGREIERKEPVTGQSLWLCEHYQRHCRVRFPCCNNFYSCHRCHNNSNECDNEEAKASHATHLKCSYCHHEQEVMKGF